MSEFILRAFVPLSSMVDPNSLYPKVWYLENFEAVRSRGQHPTHESHEILGWTHRPSLRGSDFSTNSHGLRGKREYDFEKPLAKKRVVVLGDSFSAGYGVGDEEPYSVQLEHLVPETEVLNLAVSGYGVDQAIIRWELLGYRYEPDVVLLGIFIPDFHRNVGTWWFDAPKPRFHVKAGKLSLPNQTLPPMDDFEANEKRIRRDLESFIQRPRVLIATQYLYDRLSKKMRNSREEDSTFLEKQRILELLIKRIAEDCERRGINLVVMTILTEFTPYPDEDRILSTIANASLENGVTLLNLDRFLGASARERVVEPVFDVKTGHWSAAGHRRVALKIADFIETNNFLK
ncbi:MAG: SGNH/GDSL hydrolase family protein [bacterium]